jgi:hypothetical protein
MEVLEVNKRGLRATVYVGIEPVTALLLAVAIFIGITAALAVYGKVLK